MYKWILIFLLIPSVCFAKEISRENLSVDGKYVSDGDVYFMVNMTCENENTELVNVKNGTFERCVIKNCVLDDSNSIEKSLYIPFIPEETFEDLEPLHNDLTSQLDALDIKLLELASREQMQSINDKSIARSLMYVDKIIEKSEGDELIETKGKLETTKDMVDVKINNVNTKIEE